jgi:competence CoiA-like predicted nuclease
MLYASINGESRQPLTTGERAVCPTCQKELLAVVPRENVAHWRHRGKDCDPWSESEGPWHLEWKKLFPPQQREVTLRLHGSKDFHRADLFIRHVNGKAIIVELQHSPINEKERDERERFYGQFGRLVWLIHLHDEHSFLTSAFNLGWERGTINYKNRTYVSCAWVSRSKQFIEKWKRSKADVFFSIDEHLFLLATPFCHSDLMLRFKKGEFAVIPFKKQQFIAWVCGIPPPQR